MSLFTILIAEKHRLQVSKKELFKTRQRSLCFMENKAILADTKNFQDQSKFTAVTIEGYFSSFAFPKDYQDKYYGNNRTYLESCFINLAQTQQVIFGYFFDDRGWRGFDRELAIKDFPLTYQENTLYILEPVQ